MFDELMHSLLEHQTALAIAGLLVSMLFWRWSACRYRGFVATELRLLVLALVTAGLPAPADWGYMLFWIMALANPLSTWPGFVLLIVVWWISYSIVFYWTRWILREMKG